MLMFMKKVLFMFMMLIASVTLCAQTNYGTYRQFYLNNGWNIGLEHQASLKQGGTAQTTNVLFHAGYVYQIVACSNDNDVQDVDIYIYYPDGTLFQKDVDSSSIGILKFNCTLSQYMTVVIKNYSSTTPNYASLIKYFIAWY